MGAIITPNNNGPYHVKGAFKIVTQGGREIAFDGDETWLCRCGQSANLKEALDRGHEVTAIARDPEKLQPHPTLYPLKGDAYNDNEAARLVAGHAVVISASTPGWTNPDMYDLQVKGTRAIIDGVENAGIKRLFVVGGAGSLEVKPGVKSVDLPECPAEYKQGALATTHRVYLTSVVQLYKALGGDWSPQEPGRVQPVAAVRTENSELGKVRVS